MTARDYLLDRLPLVAAFTGALLLAKVKGVLRRAYGEYARQEGEAETVAVGRKT